MSEILEKIKEYGTDAMITQKAMYKKSERKTSVPVKGIIDYCIAIKKLCSLLIDILPECFGTHKQSQRVCFICSFRNECAKKTPKENVTDDSNN